MTREVSPPPEPEAEPPEPAVNEAEALFRAAVDTVGLGVWIHDLVTGHIRSTPRMRELAGFGRDEDVHDIEAWGQRIHPGDLDTLTAQYTRVLSTRVPNGEVPYDNTYRNVHLSASCSSRTPILCACSLSVASRRSATRSTPPRTEPRPSSGSARARRPWTLSNPRRGAHWSRSAAQCADPHRGGGAGWW